MPDAFDPQAMQAWLHALGPWSWPVFLGLQVIQVVVFWIPGAPFEIAGGMVFGVWRATLLSTLGLTLGNLAAFGLARRAGKARVDRWLAGHRNPALEAVVHHRRLEVVLLGIFLVPYVPKDIFCNLAGLSNLKTWKFALATTVARIPSLLLSTWVGALAVQGASGVLAGVLGFSTVLGLVVLGFRKRLLSFLVRTGA